MIVTASKPHYSKNKSLLVSYNSDPYTYIFDIHNIYFYLLKKISKDHLIVVKIGVELKIFSLIKNLYIKSFLLCLG